MALFDTLINILTNPFFIGSAVFWLICYILIKLLGKNRKNVNFFFPFLVMFKTKRLNQILHKIAHKHPKVWKWIWNIGIIVSFGFTIFGLYFFISNLIALIWNPSIENAIAPLIPGITIDFPMFSYLILPILFVVTIHEFSHAIAAEADNIDVKSTGIFGAGVFFIVGFGAFVEIDEFETRSRKVSSWSRLRIAAAGTFSNAIQVGLALIMMLSFLPIISIGYGPQVVQIDTVLTASQGGYNAEKVFPGDIVLSINDTHIDLQAGIDLNAILNNRTDLKCSIGDQLEFLTLNRKGMYNTRIVTLGHHFFLGFQYAFVTASEIEITEVYTKFQGGNNYDVLSNGDTFSSIGGLQFNLTAGITPEYYLYTKTTSGSVNLTKNSGENVTIRIDYYPLVFGAFEFRSFFIGIFFDIAEDHVVVSRVLKNSTESGINERVVEKGDVISSVNGVNINLTGGRSFEEFLLNDVNLSITGPTLVTFEVQSDETPFRQILFIPIPKSYVFIGLQSSPYWIPKNSFTQILGGTFPIWLEKEIFYFYMVAFSVTLFNMLPLPIFDGNRILREIIHWIVGTKLGKKTQKKIKIRFDPEVSDYNLMEYNITKIIDVDMDLSTHPNPDLVDSVKFIPLDTIHDNYIDTIRFDLHSGILPDAGTQFTITVEYIEDEKAKLKNGIVLAVGLITTALVLANFLLSYLLLGNITFWI